MPDASSIRAGKAHVELGVDGKPLDKGLAEAQQKIGKWQQSIAKGAKGGNEGGLIGGLLAGGPMGAAVAAIGVAGKALFEEFVQNPRAVADAMQRMSDLSARSLEQFNARLEQTRAAMSRLDDVAATPSALRARQEELSKVRAELGGLEGSLSDARKEHEKLSSAMSSKENFSLWASAPVSGGLEGQRVVTAKNLEEAQSKYNAMLKRSIELQKQINELRDPQKNQSAKDSIESYTKAISEQVRQLELKNTLSKEEIELQKQAQKFGWNDSHFRMQEARGEIEKLRTAEANDALDEFTKAMKDQTERIVRSDLSDADFELKKILEKHKVDPNSGRLAWAREALADRARATNLEKARDWFANEQQRQLAMSGPAARGGYQFASGSQFFAGEGSGIDRLAKNQEKQLVKLDGVIAAINKAGIFIQ